MNLFIVGNDPDIPAISRRVAERSGFMAVDMAALLAERMGGPPAAFAAQKGSQTLAEMESHVLGSVARRSGCIVAVGRQIELTPANIFQMKERGLILWLKNAADDRQASDPLSAFKQAADYVLDMDGKSPDQKAEAVWNLLWE
ncbi:MAG: shikimate kinase [Thermodesulfobacteriota bacterium]